MLKVSFLLLVFGCVELSGVALIVEAFLACVISCLFLPCNFCILAFNRNFLSQVADSGFSSEGGRPKQVVVSFGSRPTSNVG